MTILFALWLSVAAAVLPTIAYVWLFHWADRYEREPAWLITVAFFWGALPAVIVSLLFEGLFGAPLAAVASPLGAEIVESALLAPVIEELAKGAALLAIFCFVRREFDGVLDGLLYGALIGFGFAMTENLLYFLGAYGEGGLESLTIVIILRAIIFGLNHSFYTGLTGIGFGLARTARWGLVRWLWPVAGLLAAMLAHALHNFGASTVEVNPLAILLTLLVAAGGLFTIALTVVLAWRHERRIFQAELADEVGGALSANEYALLLARWRSPLRRQRRNRAQRDRLQLGAELALHKARLRRLGPAREPTLPAEIARLRSQLAPSPHP